MSGRKFTRAKFEQVAHKHAKTFAEIQEMYKKGLITDDDYLFTLDGVKETAFQSYKGGTDNAWHIEENTKWKSYNDWATDSAKRIIKKAFTG